MSPDAIASDSRGTDASTQPASNRVVETVADRESTDHTDLPPLFEAIDPDALDTIVHECGGTVTFRYAGYTVEVRGANGVVVEILR